MFFYIQFMVSIRRASLLISLSPWTFFLPILLHNSNKSRILCKTRTRQASRRCLTDDKPRAMSNLFEHCRGAKEEELSIQDVTHCSYIEKTSYTLTSHFSSLFSAKQKKNGHFWLDFASKMEPFFHLREGTFLSFTAKIFTVEKLLQKVCQTTLRSKPFKK